MSLNECMTNRTAPTHVNTSATRPKASDLAAAARPDRNRAVDAYRALAMLAVALGHWAAIAIWLDSDGNIVGGNALELAPSMAWITWFFQVMPLFFVVGGFASAMSLDSHNTRGSGNSAEWIAIRLRRMVAPAVALATTWLVLMTVGAISGQMALASAGLVGAAIPLWFLANYTIDTAIAPYLLPHFRRSPGRVGAIMVATFLSLEVARFAEVPLLPQLNWVLGWLMFQTLGFAWRDGLLPMGRTMAAVAASSWLAAVSAVAFGPWPVSMVHFPGLANSPTHPPSLALLLFGFAYSTTAIWAAPAVTRFLSSKGAGQRAWTGVVGGNSMAMSVYLWHMTAAVIGTAAVWKLGWIPTADVGTSSWWVQKLPHVAISAVSLVGLVAMFGRVERRALLGGVAPWSLGPASTVGVALVVSTALKAWSDGNASTALIGCIVLVVAWHLVLSPSRSTTSA